MSDDLIPRLRNNLLDRLARDEVVASMQVRLVNGVEIAQIAKTAGFDSFYIDLEHSVMSMHDASQVCIAAIASGITPLVRVGDLSAENILRVLDNGALGIVAPHIRSAAAAAAVAAACRFPPTGNRAVSVGLPHIGFRSMPVTAMRQLMNAATAVVIMIEAPEALENVDAIAAVEGVDMLLVGTNDLCSEMGIPGEFDSPRIRDAYRAIIGAARRHGKHVGVGGLAARPDLVQEFVAMGARFVSTGTDIQFLLQIATEKAEFVRSLRPQARQDVSQ